MLYCKDNSLKNQLYYLKTGRYTKNVKNRIKVIDLFSGCGGSATGFSQAGFEIKVAYNQNYKQIA